MFGTTIDTFLMVFLIQNTQNRDAQAIHLELDELIRAGTNTRTQLVDLEEQTDDELAKLHREFRALHAQYSGQAQRVVTEVGRRNARRRSADSERESSGTD